MEEEEEKTVVTCEGSLIEALTMDYGLFNTELANTMHELSAPYRPQHQRVKCGPDAAYVRTHVAELMSSGADSASELTALLQDAGLVSRPTNKRINSDRAEEHFSMPQCRHVCFGARVKTIDGSKYVAPGMKFEEVKRRLATAYPDIVLSPGNNHSKRKKRVGKCGDGCPFMANKTGINVDVRIYPMGRVECLKSADPARSAFMLNTMCKVLLSIGFFGQNVERIDPWYNRALYNGALGTRIDLERLHAVLKTTFPDDEFGEKGSDRKVWMPADSYITVQIYASGATNYFPRSKRMCPETKHLVRFEHVDDAVSAECARLHGILLGAALSCRET